jgi:hypothetical protein
VIAARPPAPRSFRAPAAHQPIGDRYNPGLLMGAPTVSRRSRWPRRVVAILAGIALALFAAELALRAALFLPGEKPARWFAAVRQPHYFANNETDEFWKLQFLFLGPEQPEEASNADPVTGWTWQVEPKTYRVLQMPPSDGRRLVVLYGDSFAQCNTPPEQCFQAVLEESDVRDRFRMLNLGVGGYGLDQVYLLIRQTIEALKKEDPIVAVGILAENDLDRSLLSIRGLPKPRLVLRDGELIATEPVITDPERFFDAHSVGIASYLVRLIARQGHALSPELRRPWMGPKQDLAEAQALNEAILRAIHAELAARDIEHFFYIFTGQGTLPPQKSGDWQELLIRRVAEEEGVPVLCSRPYLLAAAGGDPDRAREYFGGAPGLEGHYNSVGNRVAFLGLRQGFLGEYGPEDTALAAVLGAQEELNPKLVSVSRYDLLGLAAQVTETGSGQSVRWARDDFVDAQAERPTWALAMRPGGRAPLSIVWTLPPGRWRLRGRLQYHAEAGEATHCAQMNLGVESPEAEPFASSVREGGPPVDVDLAFEGERRVEFVLRADAPSGGGPCRDWIVLRHARWQQE